MTMTWGWLCVAAGVIVVLAVALLVVIDRAGRSLAKFDEYR